VIQQAVSNQFSAAGCELNAESVDAMARYEHLPIYKMAIR
jgi:hypothetical protein